MLNLEKDIRSLSDFKRNTLNLMGRMRESGNPMVLTVNGRAELVVQDAAAYQKLLDALEFAETVQGIQRGLDDVNAGRTRPAKKAFAELRRKYRIPREPRG